MSRVLEGRVAIVTGAGQGLGRAHALYLAHLGAAVVVNDLGCNVTGEDYGSSVADKVVSEIKAQGGQAIASHHDVSDWDQANELVKLGIESFGNLHVLVNNAGILRDRSFANMTEDDWDAVIRVHLKGHAAPSRHAFAWWRQQSKEGKTVQASMIHTTSVGGLFPSFGQANYCAAKAGIIALAQVMAVEGAKYGIRSNAVAPSARTRMAGDSMPKARSEYDEFDPTHVSTLVAWLSKTGCKASGQVFHIFGGKLTVFEKSTTSHVLTLEPGWSLENLDALLADRLVPATEAITFLENIGIALADQ